MRFRSNGCTMTRRASTQPLTQHPSSAAVLRTTGLRVCFRVGVASHKTSPRAQITVRFTFSLGIFVRMIVTVKTAKGAFATDLVPAPGAQL